MRTGLGPRLRERVELSDVVQEALVEVVRQFPQFTGQNEAALVGWLRRLVGQKLADLGRYHSRAKRAGGGERPCRWTRGAAPWRCGAARRGEWPIARHAGAEPDQPQRGRQPPRADRPAGRRPRGACPSPRPTSSGSTTPRASRSRRSASGLGLSRKSIRGILARGLKHLKRSLEGPPGGPLRYDDGSAALTTATHPPSTAAMRRPDDDSDDRLGEAIEVYLALAEQAGAPDPEEFVARYPGPGGRSAAALEGLELVHGLVGRASGRRGSARGAGRGTGIGGSSRAGGSRATGSSASWAAAGMGTVYEARARRARPPGGPQGARDARGPRLVGAGRGS